MLNIIKWAKVFIAMIQFLTRIPIKMYSKMENKDYGRGLVFAPVVGAIIGGILGCFYYYCSLIFGDQLTAILTIILYVFLTGGLHIDGLGDTFDGLYSNRSKDRILEIMKDSRVGTNAVIAIFSVLIINYGVLSTLSGVVSWKIVILMPIAGRIGSVVGAGFNKYARSEEGLGKSFVDFCGIRESVIGLLFGSVFFYILIGSFGLVMAFISFISAIILSKMFAKKIDGVTGDVLGAVCEMNQSVFLIVAVVFIKFNFII